MKLYHGDCLQVMQELPAGSVDAIITDLPYGTTSCEWDSIIPLAPMWEQVKRVLKVNGIFVTTSAQPFTSVLVCSNLEWFKYDMVWDKVRVTNFAAAKFQVLRRHESILVFYKETGTYNPQKTGKASRPFGKVTGFDSPIAGNLGKDRDFEVGYPQSILEFMRPNNLTEGYLHPTQKPTKLYEYLIRTFSNPNETILDIAMGSGTTGVSAVKNGRHFIGIEKEQAYFEIAKSRIAQAPQPLFTETATPANTARTRQGDSSRQNSFFSAESDPAPSDGTTPAPCG
jgi:DNA modification methylase